MAFEGFKLFFLISRVFEVTLDEKALLKASHSVSFEVIHLLLPFCHRITLATHNFNRHSRLLLILASKMKLFAQIRLKLIYCPLPFVNFK